MSQVHASKYKPRIFPIKGIAAPSEIDRAQSIDPSVALNREKIEEIGNENIVGYLKTSPTIGYSLTQYENGDIEFWQKLANTTVKGNVGEDPITVDDFKTTYFDIVGYLTDDDDAYVGTVHYPSLRTSGFSFTIGEPQAVIERSFEFTGEKAIIWQGDNKYFIYATHTAGSGGDDEIDLSDKVPAEDPDEAGVYMFRVVRVSSGVTTELTSSDYTYASLTQVLTINSITSGDVIKVYYTSATAPDTQFTPNTSDPAGLLGDSVSVYLYVPGTGKPGSSDYIYRLQSVTIDVSFDREDLREIGNKDVVARGINDSTVTITLGRMLNNWTIEEVLRGEAAEYGKIDVSQFTDSATIIVKVFDDNTKSTFSYGIKCANLSPTDVGGGITVNEYAEVENTLEGESIVITKDTTELGI